MARTLHGRATPRKGAPRDGVCYLPTQCPKHCNYKPWTRVFRAIMLGSLSSLFDRPRALNSNQNPEANARLCVSRYKKLAAVAEDAVAVRMDAGGGGGDAEMAQ
jgi:hypothetical protein